VNRYRRPGEDPDVSTTSTPAPAPVAGPALPGRAVSALIGVLAVWAALGVGHLAAGLISPASSPYLAVGDTVIRFSPEPLTEFAKVTFGTADKPILLAGMFVVITLVAAGAGLLSRRRPGPGVTAVVVLGLLGLAAVVFAPTFAPLDLVAPVLSIGAGVAAFRWLHGLAVRAAAPSTAPATDAPAAPADGRVSRRGVLAGASAAVGVGAVAAAGVGQLFAGSASSSRDSATAALRGATLAERAPAVPAGAAFPQFGTPTFLTSNADFYRIDTALRVPSISADSWRLKLHGMLAAPVTLTFDDLLSRRLVERTITMTCVSNPIGGNLISTANFVGVELRDVLMQAGIDPAADALYSTSADGWATATPMATLMEPGRGALLAVGMNGEALPPEHGFPVRMVVPGLYGYVSATKWVVDLEATTFANPAKRGYWYQRGWAQKAPIKTMTRIDSPQPFGRAPAGDVMIAGIAWAQHTGIAAVEVAVDGGPWQRATLSDEVNVDSWRMWHSTLRLTPGSHSVQARATDKGGVVQTEQRADPIPDGASGWPNVIFNVA
jgi:DMSO/TMAO reductase YedYZ molybdopterin-dependent catalytic subunit